MPQKTIKRRTKLPKSVQEEYQRRLSDIYKQFHLKASQIGAKNFQILDTAMKKIDYLQITHLLQQIKVL